MGKPTGFLEIPRHGAAYAPVAERLRHYREFMLPADGATLSRQGARCMDCGIPFCHSGCPVNNLIPDWNDLVYRDRWREALETLHSTNNFPEFTGRVCPAPCEAACTLNLTDEAVTIKSIEHAIVEKGWAEGWIRPEPAARRTGKRVAVVGAGPAGMACAQQLARAGHAVVLFEKNATIGGLLRYGIPDFKLEKRVIDRRAEQMAAEGVEVRTNHHVGRDIGIGELVGGFDAVVLSGGSEKPRDLPAPGRELAGVHFAMEFLTQQNRRLAGEPVGGPDILAGGKHVVVIGGGDTGSDCIGTSNRHGAALVTQLEIMPQPPARENKQLTWPDWPLKLRTSSSHEEGCDRDFAVATKRFIGSNGKLEALECVRMDWVAGDDGRQTLREVEGSEFELKADLVLLAMGFVGPRHEGFVTQARVELDPRGNVKAPVTDYRTTAPNIFSCGDMRRGQSLVVWAIREGRQCAQAVDTYLMGTSKLPR